MSQRTLSEALKYRARLLEDFSQGQLERINKYSECCTSARDRDRENFGWDFVGGLSTDEGRPYQNYSQYLNILRRSVGVFEDSATMQGIAAKYISYVLGKEGAKYTVEKKPDKDICSLEELTNSSRTPLSFDQSDIKKMNCIIDVVSHTANDWLSLQKDGLWEYFRTGEMIRRTSELVKQKFPEVDIVTSFQVRPPNTTRTSLPTTNRSTTKINAEYGIRYISGRPRTYYILDEGGENPVGHPVERIQHIKFGSQKKNPRAVPPFFVVRENADGIKQYEFGIRESFLARSLNSVIWELPPASAADGSAMAFLEARGYANEDIKSQARVGLPDGTNGYTPDRSLTGEVHTTSKVVYPSPNLGADEVISLIKMEQTMIGLVVCMADYLSTGSSDTGNRATLQESGDPFTAAIIQGRTLLAKTDAELFWRILQIWFGWSESQLIAAQMQLEIKSNFSEIVKEDESKIANAASILVTANIWSKAQARRRTKVDPDQMKREIEQEKEEEPTPAQQQLQNGEQNGNGQPFQPKLDSPSEDEQTPSTPAEQIQNRRPQGTNPASTSNRSATEQEDPPLNHSPLTEEDIFSPEKQEDNQPDASFPGLVEHTPGGKEHDQQKHGRRNGSSTQQQSDEDYLNQFGYSRDNPGGSWLENQQKNAREGKGRGAVTASTKNLPMPVDDLLLLPGQNKEHLIKDEARQKQIDDLADKIKAEGFDEDQGILVWVDVNGRGTIAEGNRRIRAAKKAGLKSVPVQFRWFAGSEDRDGFWGLENVIRKSKKTIEENNQSFPGEPLTEEVLEEFLGEVDNTGQQVSHNTVLENLQRAGYKIPENWQRRLQEHTPGGQDHDHEQDSTESSDTLSETNQDDEGEDPKQETEDQEAENTPEPNLQEALDMLNESLGLEDKEDCPQCQGTGLVSDDLCPSCKGTGNK